MTLFTLAMLCACGRREDPADGTQSAGGTGAEATPKPRVTRVRQAPPAETPRVAGRRLDGVDATGTVGETTSTTATTAAAAPEQTQETTPAAIAAVTPASPRAKTLPPEIRVGAVMRELHDDLQQIEAEPPRTLESVQSTIALLRESVDAMESALRPMDEKLRPFLREMRAALDRAERSGSVAEAQAALRDFQEWHRRADKE